MSDGTHKIDSNSPHEVSSRQNDASLGPGPGSAEQRDRTMLRIAGSTLLRVRDTRGNCSSQSCGDLPVGRFVDRRVQPPLQKYFCFRTPQITSTTPAIPSHQEGRFAIVTDVGCGMRWTRQRQVRAGRMMLMRTAKSCGPDAPALASSLAEVLSALPGSDKTLIREMTVAKEPGHRGEPDISR